jgi:hypothetical protein
VASCRHYAASKARIEVKLSSCFDSRRLAGLADSVRALQSQIGRRLIQKGADVRPDSQSCSLSFSCRLTVPYCADSLSRSTPKTEQTSIRSIERLQRVGPFPQYHSIELERRLLMSCRLSSSRPRRIGWLHQAAPGGWARRKADEAEHAGSDGEHCSPSRYGIWSWVSLRLLTLPFSQDRFELIDPDRDAV